MHPVAFFFLSCVLGRESKNTEFRSPSLPQKRQVCEGEGKRQFMFKKTRERKAKKGTSRDVPRFTNDSLIMKIHTVHFTIHHPVLLSPTSLTSADKSQIIWRVLVKAMICNLNTVL